ncbi:MAG: hypothetical protein NC299_08980 [Lachnospiraceae bacterium]|nr:hypothetical protein [Lachnospiraceae bacterium]
MYELDLESYLLVHWLEEHGYPEWWVYPITGIPIIAFLAVIAFWYFGASVVDEIKLRLKKRKENKNRKK